MKKTLIFSVLAGFLIFSCNDKNTTTETETTTDRSEISNEMEPKTMQSVEGDKVTLTYFAQNGEVALKLKKNNEAEHILRAKGVSEEQNPIFTNEVYMWEMTNDGQTGTLTDKDGKQIRFSPNAGENTSAKEFTK
ncbi:MAG: hypothetical protein Q4C75_00855 [Bergeyella zoohelcum]|nr:hypothetical protein [Bergeyella zoohelcum]